MPVIGFPTPYLETWEPTTGTRAHRESLGSINGNVYPAHDGRYILLTRLTTQTVTPFDLSTNTQGSTINIGTNPVGIWYDGRFLWKISSGGVLGRMDLETSTVIETISLPVDVYSGLTGFKRFLWTMDLTTGNVDQIDTTTGTIVGTFTKPANASDLYHDGRFLWFHTGDSGVQGTVKQYDPATGTLMNTFNVTNYGLNDLPNGIDGDGRFLYLTLRLF